MGRKPSVIIIDDDKELLDELSMFLEMREIEIKGKGYNGCDADDLYRQTHPDFVLLDMKMPDYDGEYAIKKIKEYDPNAKIFVLTGHLDHSFGKEVEQIFTKPCNLKKLVQEIKQVC